MNSHSPVAADVSPLIVFRHRLPILALLSEKAFRARGAGFSPLQRPKLLGPLDISASPQMRAVKRRKRRAPLSTEPTCVGCYNGKEIHP
jgi:hypothetical protein